MKSHYPPFRPMAEVIPEGERGNARVTHLEVSEDDARSYNIRAAMSGNGIAQVSPGRYARLTVDRTIVMSDTPMEQQTNRRVVQEARGDVLVAGLGLGMVLLPILEKEEVTSATVVEVNEDVVALVSPHLPQEKLRVVSADILEWSPPPGEKFDTLYFDIWPEICTDNLATIASLHQRFKKHKRPGGFMESWMQDYLRSERRRWR